MQTLLLACDAAFERVRLVPINGNEVEFYRARNLYAVEAWSQRAVGRLYVPQYRHDGKVSAFFVVKVHRWPKSATHALLVLAYAEPSPPATPQSLASEYNTEISDEDALGRILVMQMRLWTPDKLA